MNPKVAKNASKLAFGIAVTFTLGLIIRLEDRVDNKIDAHYDAKLETPKADQ